MCRPVVFSVTTPLKLYVKHWCPWCVDAIDYLEQRGYSFDTIDVERDRAAYAEMRRLSGQSLTPTLVVGDKVLPDFGTDELEEFLKEHNIQP